MGQPLYKKKYKTAPPESLNVLIEETARLIRHQAKKIENSRKKRSFSPKHSQEAFSSINTIEQVARLLRNEVKKITLKKKKKKK